jgi:hypothetical protein
VRERPVDADAAALAEQALGLLCPQARAAGREDDVGSDGRRRLVVDVLGVLGAADAIVVRPVAVA